MEHRTDLERILLDGLPEQERHDTVASIQRTTAKKLARLQRQRAGEIDLTQAEAPVD